MLNKTIINSFSVAAVLLVAMVPFANAQASNTANVPPGTEVVVKTLETMTSKTSKTGDKFAVVVVNDVVVDQQVVIPAGARGTGTVIFGRAKRSGGVSGALDVRIDSVDTPSGPIKLKASDANRGADRRSAGTVASLAFGMIGFLAVQGEEITLNAGTEIRTIVPMPRNVAATAVVLTSTTSDASTATANSAQIITAQPPVAAPVSVTPDEALHKE
jgi:hypothetical protein